MTVVARLRVLTRAVLSALQDGFDPVSRLISCHIGFRLRGRRGAPPPPQPPSLRRAFSYRWRLWTLPEVCDMLRLAGFASTHVWVSIPHN
jgi:hypothetical protein